MHYQLLHHCWRLSFFIIISCVNITLFCLKGIWSHGVQNCTFEDTKMELVKVCSNGEQSKFSPCPSCEFDCWTVCTGTNRTDHNCKLASNRCSDSVCGSVYCCVCLCGSSAADWTQNKIHFFLFCLQSPFSSPLYETDPKSPRIAQ